MEYWMEHSTNWLWDSMAPGSHYFYALILVCKLPVKFKCINQWAWRSSGKQEWDLKCTIHAETICFLFQKKVIIKWQRFVTINSPTIFLLQPPSLFSEWVCLCFLLLSFETATFLSQSSNAWPHDITACGMSWHEVRTDELPRQPAGMEGASVDRVGLWVLPLIPSSMVSIKEG